MGLPPRSTERGGNSFRGAAGNYLLAGLWTMEGFSEPINVITSPFSFAGTFN
jgi:hypothetical protein